MRHTTGTSHTIVLKSSQGTECRSADTCCRQVDSRPGSAQWLVYQRNHRQSRTRPEKCRRTSISNSNQSETGTARTTDPLSCRNLSRFSLSVHSLQTASRNASGRLPLPSLAAGPRRACRARTDLPARPRCGTGRAQRNSRVTSVSRIHRARTCEMPGCALVRAGAWRGLPQITGLERRVARRAAACWSAPHHGQIVAFRCSSPLPGAIRPARRPGYR